MSIKVYSVSGAPRAWRILLGLAFKGLDYELVTLQISKGELKTPEFLKLNPRGTVPVLTDGENVISDSLGGMAWLDRAYSGTPLLFGDDVESASIIWQRVSDANDYLREAADKCLRPILVSKEGLPAVGTDEFSNWLKAAQTFKAELSILEEYLEESDFLAGDRPSALDAVCYPELRILERAMDTKNATMEAVGLGSLQEFPCLTDWLDRVSQLPAVSLTEPSHWKE